MRIGTIVALIGIAPLALGGFWYWRLSQIAPSFAGTAVLSSLHRTQTYAIALACLGPALALIGMVINSLADDENA